MELTLRELYPLLAYGAAPGGAGVLAYFVFNWLRARDWPTRIDNVLCSPEYARYTVIGLSLVISLLFSGLVAVLDNVDVRVSLDTAGAEFVKAAVAYLFSQIVHARLDLPAEPARKLTDIEDTAALPTRITGL